MSSRDKILNTVKGNQPGQRPLPPLPGEEGYGAPADAGDGSHEASHVVSAAERVGSLGSAGHPAVPTLDAGGSHEYSPVAHALDADALVQKFITVLEGIGGSAYIVSGLSRIVSLLHEEYPDARRIISGVAGLESLGESGQRYPDSHTLENVDVAVLSAHFGVAENGACWITEDRMIERALPFIAQNLVLVIRRKDIVANMHQAYSRIEEIEAANGSYGFATFIAGPSKTADIEQSLVLGAHGPKSMTVFLLDEAMFDAGFF